MGKYTEFSNCSKKAIKVRKFCRPEDTSWWRQGDDSCERGVWTPHHKDTGRAAPRRQQESMPTKTTSCKDLSWHCVSVKHSCPSPGMWIHQAVWEQEANPVERKGVRESSFWALTSERTKYTLIEMKYSSNSVMETYDGNSLVKENKFTFVNSRLLCLWHSIMLHVFLRDTNEEWKLTFSQERHVIFWLAVCLYCNLSLKLPSKEYLENTSLTHHLICPNFRVSLSL